jgi:hypothetical protein
MARSSEVLPTPLRPSTQVTLPVSPSAKRPQRLRRAVVEIDRRRRVQHGRSSAPRDRLRRPARRRKRVERALGQHRALVQHGDLDASERTKSMSCSTTTTEWSPAISTAELGGALCISASVMPAAGSSTSSSFGSCISSMPISSHCFWPWDRFAAGSSRLVARPMSSSSRRCAALGAA